jgi:hypothetical protein
MRKVPFPQANNLQMLFEIFINLDNNGISKFEVVERYGLVEREAAYYLDALQYLNLVKKHKLRYFLEHEGGNFTSSRDCKTHKEFAKNVLKNPFILILYLNSNNIIDKKERMKYIAERISANESLNLVTSMRRASTMVSWFTWVDKYKE